MLAWLLNLGFAASPIQAAATAALTGTVVGSTEIDIATGGKTVILTIANDTWVSAGAVFDAQRQNVIDGLDAATNQVTGWNAEVRDKEVVTAVVRTSDTVVTITLSTSLGYNIVSPEIVTATVPASALVFSAVDVIATPSFTIDWIGAIAVRNITLRI